MRVSLFSVLSVIVIIASYFLPKEVLFVSALIYIIFFYRKSGMFKKTYFSILLPIAILFLIGLFFGINNDFTDFSRDIYTVISIMVYFIFGIILVRRIRDFKHFFLLIKIASILSALLHIVLFVYYYSTAESLDHLRILAGRGSLVESIYLGVFISKLTTKRIKLFLPRGNQIGVFSFLLVLISFVLYFSRSMLISTIVITGFVSGFINIRNIKISFRKVALIFATIVLFASVLGTVSSMSTDNPFEWVIAKFEHIPEEIFWDSQKNKTASFGEINDNWRGYEAYQGIIKFDEGNVIQKVFGYGWGSLVDLNLTMQLGDKDYTKIPVLHNGYVMLLVKSGIFGEILYIVFLYFLGFKKNLSNDKNREVYYYYQMLSALSLLTLLNTFTISGLLNSQDLLTPVLLGLFWGLVNYYKKDEVPLPIHSNKENYA